MLRSRSAKRASVAPFRSARKYETPSSTRMLGATLPKSRRSAPARVPRMSVPARTPRSNPNALAARFSEENCSRIFWAVRRPAGPAVNARAKATALVKPLNARSGEVSGENGFVALPRARPSHRPPLTEPHAVPPSRARRDHPAHLPALARDVQLERLAAERAIGLGAQHVADVRAGHADVTAREDDPQLADATRRRRPAHLDIGDALQPVTTHVHDRRKRPRQYSAQLRGVPLLAPAEPRRNVAVVASAAALVRDGAQVRARGGGLERLFDAGGAVPAGGVEVGVDQLAPIAQHRPRRRPHGIPRLRRFARGAGVHLVPHVGEGVHALRLPAPAILQGERPRDD